MSLIDYSDAYNDVSQIYPDDCIETVTLGALYLDSSGSDANRYAYTVPNVRRVRLDRTQDGAISSAGARVRFVFFQIGLDQALPVLPPPTPVGQPPPLVVQPIPPTPCPAPKIDDSVTGADGVSYAVQSVQTKLFGTVYECDCEQFQPLVPSKGA